MDFTRLTQGEKIAGASGIALILIMFIFDWFGLKLEGAEAFGVSVEGSRNAWGSYGFIDIVLFLTVAAAIGLALISASQTRGGPSGGRERGRCRPGDPLGRLDHLSASSARRTSVPICRVRGVENTRKIGVWLGLIAAIGVAYGGWRAMQEEGTSFGEQADRFREPDEGPGATPPPPPPRRRLRPRRPHRLAGPRSSQLRDARVPGVEVSTATAAHWAAVASSGDRRVAARPGMPWR